MINSFSGRYRFLSNFSPAAVELDGVTYPTVEHAFVAAKTTDVSLRTKVRTIEKPGDVKRFGRALKLRSDWESIKLAVMEDLVRKKFRHPELAKDLLLTGDHDLVEGNYWHDNVWGQCDCVFHAGKGQNHLGKILMKIRDELRQHDDPAIDTMGGLTLNELSEGIRADNGELTDRVAEVSWKDDVEG